ncbi:hypothetical protein [Streptomyces oceani]|uniref:hypothetical protein n=1 Tax=Streptomyces oceani TaxID=1075402 RepID=UPI000872BEEC|nr:hypothetical protein [Streptomyces oceani]
MLLDLPTASAPLLSCASPGPPDALALVTAPDPKVPPALPHILVALRSEIDRQGTLRMLGNEGSARSVTSCAEPTTQALADAAASLARS